MEKVYCGKIVNEELKPNCRHFIIIAQDGGQWFQCHEPANLEGNPIAKGMPLIPPHEKNKGCDCLHFQEAIEEPKTVEVDRKPASSTEPLTMPSGGRNWNLEK